MTEFFLPESQSLLYNLQFSNSLPVWPSAPLNTQNLGISLLFTALTILLHRNSGFWISLCLSIKYSMARYCCLVQMFGFSCPSIPGPRLFLEFPVIKPQSRVFRISWWKPVFMVQYRRPPP